MIQETITNVIYHNTDVRMDDDDWVGIEVQTNQQSIQVWINSQQYCCENYDVVLVTPDKVIDPENLNDYEITHIGWGNNIHPDYKWALKNNTSFRDDDYYAIVNIETQKGLIQIIAFNHHNGFYPHWVKVSWKNYSDTQQI